MFTEPLAVTVNGAAESLNRIATGDRKASYRTADKEFTVHISHDEKNRNRRTVRLVQTITAADPLLDGVSREYTQTASFTLDSPRVGFSATQEEKLGQGLVDFLDVAGNLTKVVSGES